MDNKLIQIEPPPPQVLEYLKKRPETDFKCWQNALPDDPTGERRSTFVNWYSNAFDLAAATASEAALAAWEFVWKMWKRKYEHQYDAHRREIDTIRSQRDEHWNRYLMIGER